MNCNKSDSFAEKRGTYIALSIFFFFALCFYFAMDARGYFFRMWNGTKIQIGDVEMTLPKGYYIDSKEKGEYVICDIDGNRVQLYIEAWKGNPKIDKMEENVKKIGGIVRAYELYDQPIHEFIFRNDKWKNNLGGIIYLFPKQKIEITYAGPTFMMYRTMNSFVRNFKEVQ